MRYLILIFVLVACSDKAKTPKDQMTPIITKGAAPQDQPHETPLLTQAFWATCAGESEHEMVTLECGDLTITYTKVQTENADKEVLRQELLRMSVQGLKDEGVKISREESPEFHVPNSNTVGFDLRIDAEGDTQSGYGLMASATKSATLLANVLCFDFRSAASPLECKHIASHILVHGIPEHVVKTDARQELNFAGRKIAIPSGCISGGGEEINCLSAHFAWEYLQKDAAPESENTFIAAILEGFQRVMPESRPDMTEISCRIDDVSTRCQRRIWRDKGMSTMMISGRASVRSRRLVFACSWKVDQSDERGLPPPCRELLVLD